MPSVSQELVRDRLAARLACLYEPAYLVTELLGYGLKPFHQRMFESQVRNRRTINLAPRGHGKSTVCTIAYSIWRLLKNRDIRILIVSNTSFQAVSFGQEIKKNLMSEKVAELFGDMQGTPWNDARFVVEGRQSTAKEATVTCMGVGGPIITQHYDVIILDDVVDEGNSRTEYQRRQVSEWFKKQLLPCLDEPDTELKKNLPPSELHILGTRWHPNDLYKMLMDGDKLRVQQGEVPLYAVITLQAISKDGEALWPEKFSLPKLIERKSECGTVVFGLQYQNDDEQAKGKIFKEEWFEYYSELPANVKVVRGVDPQIKKGETNDFFVNLGIAITPDKRIYILSDIVRERPSFSQKVAICKEKERTSNAQFTIVEAVQAQYYLYEACLEEGMRVFPYYPDGDKIARAQKVSVYFENHQVYLPLGCSGLVGKLVDELLLAPDCEHDDLMDALTSAILEGMRRIGVGKFRETSGTLEHMEKVMIEVESSTLLADLRTMPDEKMKTYVFALMDNWTSAVQSQLTIGFEDKGDALLSRRCGEILDLKKTYGRKAV